jgi:ribosome maturation factor RimP
LRAKGSVVGVWLNNPVEAKTYLEGEIVEANEHNIVLRAKDKTYTLEPAGIKLGKARLDLKS